METQNPRIKLLKQDAEQRFLKPFRSHGWSANIILEHDYHSSIEIEAVKAHRKVRIGLLYSSATENSHYRILASSCERIFHSGSAYMLDSFAHGIDVPVESVEDFFPFLVSLNKEIDPDRTPKIFPSKPKKTRRITDENPLQAVVTRLIQFTSPKLAQRLVIRRAEEAGIFLREDQVKSKAAGVAFAMRNGLDYFDGLPSSKLNKRILGLYYGTIAFASAEMLALPNGVVDLDEVEGMTKQGHGLYTVSGINRGFGDLQVGVLATGFLPNWITTLGYDITDYPRRKPKALSDVEKQPAGMCVSLEKLFASIPEIEDLYAEVFEGGSRWVIPVYSSADNHRFGFDQPNQPTSSTYAHFIDYSKTLTKNDLEQGGWPLAEISREESQESKYKGRVFRARVDHTGFDLWWNVLPTHTSPFKNRTTLLLPTVGGLRDYRVIAAVILYALSIMVRYMPSAWRRIEGGDEDQFLALVNASLSAWERVLPEQFLESIAGEGVQTGQPGGLFG
ncbi:YaaC family protein [Jiella avicenniae]|uniref:YaaC-like Protein n=1 Tax=Jiella avicenniae TaxID=2907202 RepID=A0A9X1P833_9HYPH|nr:hypothetical protein [Jiella avicenniae]MCE7030921.1 hypothetical protein [Jiella avicenniae]